MLTTNTKSSPTLASIPEELGEVSAAALDTGFFSEANIEALQAKKIEPYIATGRDPHNRGWRAYFAEAGILLLRMPSSRRRWPTNCARP